MTVANTLQTALVSQVAGDGKNAVEQNVQNVKTRTYQECSNKEGLEFVVMAVDTFGGWHSTSLQILSKVGRQLVRREKYKTVRHLRQRLVVMLFRDNMVMLLSRVPVLPGPEITGQL